MFTVNVVAEKETKNTIRFTEVLKNKRDVAMLGNGTVYLNREALKAQGFDENSMVKVTIEVVPKETAEGTTTAAAKNEAATEKFKKAQAKKKAAKAAPKRTRKAPAKKEAEAPAKQKAKTPAKTAKKAPARKRTKKA